MYFVAACGGRVICINVCLKRLFFFFVSFAIFTAFSTQTQVEVTMTHGNSLLEVAVEYRAEKLLGNDQFHHQLRLLAYELTINRDAFLVCFELFSHFTWS